MAEDLSPSATTIYVKFVTAHDRKFTQSKDVRSDQMIPFDDDE
jgi:hypothetical protein